MLPPLINGSPHGRCSHMPWWQAQSVYSLPQSYSFLSSLLVEMASHVSFRKCWTFISPDSPLARDSHGSVLTNKIWRDSIRSVRNVSSLIRETFENIPLLSCFEWSGRKMWCLALKQSFCHHEGRVTWIAKTWTHADIIDPTLEPPTSHLLFN